MAFSRPDTQTVNRRIAANIAFYRRSRGMTQSELAELINYSDKSVSKWERGAAAPDIYVLVSIAELYGVTVNDLLSENAPLPPPDADELRFKRRIVMCLQMIVGVWFVATIAFAVWKMFFSQYSHSNAAWLTFIFAVPVSLIILVVTSALWWGPKTTLISVSALAWTLAACVYLFLSSLSYAWLLFTVFGAAQILIVLWYVRLRLSARTARRATADSRNTDE
ncbi:MAG: helix-turn-helix domain-containing protein [Oscillospiraceae bacterium]|nr:helix-turn-helix domain-containing protein [Oscillospiraceae bacterium]